MSRTVDSMAAKAAMSPGSLVHVGEASQEPLEVIAIQYDGEQCHQVKDPGRQELSELARSPAVDWLKVSGVHQPEVIGELGEVFGLHTLLLEDVVNTQQRPKMEDFGEYLFVVLKHFWFQDGELRNEQISLVLADTWVISFQEGRGSPFDSVIERIVQNKGRIRRMGADYLAYALMDVVVDQYFVVLEALDEELEELEEEVLVRPGQDSMQAIYRLKLLATALRKAVWPLREVVAFLSRGDSPLLSEKTQPFCRDLYDNTIQVLDGCEALRDNLASIKDVFLSSLSNRMNEVMKVLTIIATLFIPLTFLAGVYGMNFKHMPELELKWAYPAVWGLMMVVAGSMLWFFKRRGWF